VERLEHLHQCLQGLVDDGKHAGISTLLIRDAQVVDFFATGFQNRELKIPMQRDTLVRVYSMTKIVVSVAALTLLEEGRFGLHDSLADYLPEFGDPKVLVGGTTSKLVSADTPITLQHLFTHTSGLVYESPGDLIHEFYAAADLESANSLAEIVSRLARLPLKHQPGTVFEYGYSTDVLARVIEVVSGRSLGDYLNKRIFGPLAMPDTNFAVPVGDRARLAKVYEHGAGGDLRPVASLTGEVEDGVRKYPSGGSGLFSTLDDFARFCQMLCNRGELNGSRILGRKTVELMVANHLSGLAIPYHNLGYGHGFGLGVAVRLNDAIAGTLGTLGSIGWTGLATTLCYIDPAEQLVMLCFAQHLPFDEHGLFQRFMNLVYQALV
jgi:CubicO group peptidase (beta-lactamase class C family)